jgi:hypothetical protein
MIRVEAIPILAARLEQATQRSKQTTRHDGPEVRAGARPSRQSFVEPAMETMRTDAGLMLRVPTDQNSRRLKDIDFSEELVMVSGAD